VPQRDARSNANAVFLWLQGCQLWTQTALAFPEYATIEAKRGVSRHQTDLHTAVLLFSGSGGVESTGSLNRCNNETGSLKFRSGWKSLPKKTWLRRAAR
jgi:hypothetical protein